MTEPRADVLFYVQHLLGIGHLNRALALARAMGRAGLNVVFVTGGLPVVDMQAGAARIVQLPPARVMDAGFRLADAAGNPVTDHWKAARRDKLLELYRSNRPRLLVLELFPFGRRQMRFELLPLLELAGAERPKVRIISSVRDVLNTTLSAEKVAWMCDTARRHFDQVIVHGDPKFLPLEASFPAAGELAHLIRYSGYVVEQDRAPPTADHRGDEILVSTGGGAVGGPLIEACLQARSLSPAAESPWRILAGKSLPEDIFQLFRTNAPHGVTVERARPDFAQLLAHCRLSISQAGYNTVMDILQSQTPALVVPFAAEGETEQAFRAEALSQLGLLTVAPEKNLDGPLLAAGIADAMERTSIGSPAAVDIDLGGAAKTAKLLKDLLMTVES